ncbi:MAG: nicotinamide mononucleotide transporter [Flavobacteriales bacterium]|nr:nicotinamide mononucleotide transporter [Flavobacteriales bacterium]MBK7083735.1 nicotinamide mononucleotide transporter [Flavobacteriales bacterium]MBK7269976.1 nicotinamide mononucleotide transporter [Flavobacteriales bacterium]MBK7753562.1 nicotinamide mononucleotide transporter [Flavobacteriales bacterium]MBK9538414.1 nicotinamide mononucleotide transporter [Flavobacteriales bacterium]
MSPTTALILEWSAVALNILFTILIALEKRLGWLFGLVAALIGVLLYVVQDAWLMASLNAFYAGMGAYGWWTWGRAGGSARIISYGWRMHAMLITIGAAGTGLLAWAMEHWQVPGEYHGMEAFITAFAMLATWLMSAKAIENWFYWTVGDLLAVWYNHLIGYDGYAFLNVVYIVLAVAGFIRWQHQFKAQKMIRIE